MLAAPRLGVTHSIVEVGEHDGERGFEFMRGISRETYCLLKAAFQALHHAVEHVDELGEFAVVIALHRDAFGEIAGVEMLGGADDAFKWAHGAFRGPHGAEASEGEANDTRTNIPLRHAIDLRIVIGEREADEDGVIWAAEGTEAPVDATRARGEGGWLPNHGHLRTEGLAALWGRLLRCRTQTRWQTEQIIKFSLTPWPSCTWWTTTFAWLRLWWNAADFFRRRKATAEVNIEILGRIGCREDCFALTMFLNHKHRLR